MRAPLRHLCADGIILGAAGAVFLVRRAQEPHAGDWVFPGGHVELGETIEEAVRREILEETRLVVVRSVLVGSVADGDRLVVALLCHVEGMPVVDPFECTEWGWFAGDHLPLNTWRRDLLERARSIRLETT